MEINAPKCVGIPLWGDSIEAVQAEVSASAPLWGVMPVRHTATYLGCAVGPGKMDMTWDRAICRFKERVSDWQWSSLGLNFSILAYNIYVLPTLAFTAQIAHPTAQVLEVEAWALRRAAPGPGCWATPEDLWSLGEHFGMPRSFGSLQHVAKASQLRVAVWENRFQGGLRVDARVHQLQQAWLDADFAYHAARLQEWRRASIPNVLASSTQALRDRGITSSRVIELIAVGGRPGRGRRLWQIG